MAQVCRIEAGLRASRPLPLRRRAPSVWLTGLAALASCTVTGSAYTGFSTIAKDRGGARRRRTKRGISTSEWSLGR